MRITAMTLCILGSVAMSAPAMSAQDNPFRYSCVVDRETLEVRNLKETDPESLAADQGLRSQEWAFDYEITVDGRTYARFGLPRIHTASEFKFHTFKDTVPFMAEAGDGPAVPDIIYAPYNAAECEIQAYSRVVTQ